MMTILKIELSGAWWVRPAVVVIALAAAAGVRMDIARVSEWVGRRGIVVKRTGRP